MNNVEPKQVLATDGHPMDLAWLLDCIVAAEPIWGSLGQEIAVPLHMADLKLFVVLVAARRPKRLT